jgi:hypothetical protein
MISKINNSGNGIDLYPVHLEGILRWVSELKSGEFFLILVTLALVIATIGLCYYTKELVENKKNEHWFKIYFEYNKRFSEIMMLLSDLKNAPPEQRGNSSNEKMLSLMTSYFNLCLEEYTLEKKRLLKDNQLWDQWRQGIINYMGYEEFQNSWKILQKNKCYPEEFRIYIDNLKDKAEQKEMR